MVSDLSRIERVRDRLPEDKMEDLEFSADHIAFKAPLGEVRLKIVEREAPKCVKFETEQSPVPFNFWIQVLPVTARSCKFKLTVKAELNPFIKGIVKQPLHDALEKIADVLQMIRYE